MIPMRLVTVVLGSFLLVAGGTACEKKSPGGAGGGGTGADCEAEFDKKTHQDKYVQCKACESQHRGMGSMEKDCKDKIPKPWK